jgi:teichuronic acid biosynthesis glycosyltransferase TuaH
VAVSQVLADGLRSSGIETLLIPNGVDVAVFKDAGVPSAGGDDPPVTAFVGHLSERVDVALLTAVADRGMRLRMIGPPQETMKEGHLGPLQGHPNVEWAGRVAYSQLGRALSDVTTCVLPYGNTAFNRASFPLKILEYLAAGRRVVSTDLPSVRWLDTPLVDRADGVGDFADAVERSLASPLTVVEIAERRAFAEQHSWAARTRLLADRLGLAEALDPAGRQGAGVP